MPKETKINGKEYAWCDMEIVMSGKTVPLTGVTAIEYGVKREHSNVFGKGKEPVAQVSGQKQPDGCSITLLQSEFEALQKSIGKGSDPTDLKKFNITVSYAPEDGARVTDRMLDCLVAGFSKASGTDKKNMEIKLDLTVRKIQFGID